MRGSGLVIRVLTVIAGCSLAGCGSGGGTGTVNGTVKHNGKPVAGGTVNFLGKNGAAAVGKIDAGGAYKIDEPLDVGEYKVYYGAPLPEPAAPGTKAPPKPKDDLPPKHKDPATGVAVTVTAGANVIPVQFKD
jgi:hypothetical protein